MAALIYYFPDSGGEEKLTPEDWSIWNFFMPIPSKWPKTGDPGFMFSYQNDSTTFTKLSYDEVAPLPFTLSKFPDEALRYFLQGVFEAKVE
jgi:hypothetical protein